MSIPSPSVIWKEVRPNIGPYLHKAVIKNVPIGAVFPSTALDGVWNARCHLPSIKSLNMATEHKSQDEAKAHIEKTVRAWFEEILS